MKPVAMSRLTHRLACRMAASTLLVKNTTKSWIPYFVPSISQSTTDWMNLTSHCGRLKKIWKFFPPLGIVVTLPGSNPDAGKAHLANRFQSTVRLILFQTVHYTVGKSGVAVNCYVGTDSPKFPTRRICCSVFVCCWSDVADRSIRLLPTCK